MKILIENEDSNKNYKRLEKFLGYVNAHKPIYERYKVSMQELTDFFSDAVIGEFVDNLIAEYDIEESDIDEV